MQAKAWSFLKHELSRINHELTINGWRRLWFLAESAERFGQAYYLVENAENADFTLNFQQPITYNQ